MPRQVTERKSGGAGKFLLTVFFLLVLAAVAYVSYNLGQGKQFSFSLSSFPFKAKTTNNPSINLSATPVAPQPQPSPAPVPTPAASSTPPGVPVLQLTINPTPTKYLNVRSQPSSAGAIISQVFPGETYTYTASQNGWYKIICIIQVVFRAKADLTSFLVIIGIPWRSAPINC